jgi:aldehyde:ferredoxin oxidoreductase
MDSMILCKFLRGVFDDPFTEWAALLAVVTGWDIDAAELHETAVRIVLAKRAYNAQEGWVPDDDWLPARLLDDSLTLASGRVGALDRVRLRTMIDAYYEARGLDHVGRPVTEKARRLTG